MKYGIILCGEKALTLNDPDNAGTIITTWPTKRDDVLANFAAKENFMLLVNIDESNLNTWKKSYPTSVTAVRNIFFYNG